MLVGITVATFGNGYMKRKFRSKKLNKGQGS